MSISYDGKTMIYTGIENDKIQFYQSTKNAMWEWDNDLPINGLNKYLDSTVTVLKDPFFSYDGQMLYFVANMQDSKGLDIFYSTLKNGEWQKPIAINASINTSEDEESPSITADNKYIYFTRKAVPAKPISDEDACRKIYRAVRNEQGLWDNPEEVKISNVGCEAYPLVLPNGKALIFSSSKLPQKKKFKYDVFYVRENIPGNWGMPIALDSLNTEANEISVAVDYRAKKLSVLQVEQVKKETKVDMATINLPSDIEAPTYTSFTCKIYDLANNSPVSAKVTVRNPITLGIVNTTESDENGNFKLMLTNGVDYKFNFYSHGYSQYSRNYFLSKTNFDYILNDSVKLFKNVQLKLNVYDKAVFNPISATITAFDFTNDKQQLIAEKQKTAGQFILKLPVGKKYKVKVEQTGYSGYTFIFDLSQTVMFNEFEEDIALNADRTSYKINVASVANNIMLNARVEAFNKKIDEVVDVHKINQGVFTAALRKNSEYAITVTQKAYSFDSRIVKTNTIKSGESLDIKLIPLIRGTKIALASIEFGANLIELSTESYYELDCLAGLMIENPEITIELAAYTDNKAEAAYCDRLTAKQAQAMADYLIMRGITKERIKTKGYGKNAPANLQQTGSKFNAKNTYTWFTIVEPAKEWIDIPASETDTEQAKGAASAIKTNVKTNSKGKRKTK